MKIIRNIVLLALVVGGLYALFQSGLIPWGDDEDENELEEMVASAEKRDIESSLLLTGEVVPAFQIEVKSEVGGKVKKLHIDTGETVETGQALATIDDTELLTDKAAALTEIEGAQLAVDKIRANYERAESLYVEKLISKEVYDNLGSDLAIAENTLEKSKSRLQTVEDRLRKTRIEAPANGTVLDMLVNEGQVVVAAASVNSGTVLMNIADLSRLLINSHVNQVDAASLAPGQEIKVEVTGTKGATLQAIVEFIAPVATVRNNVKGFQVQALIQENDGRLKPGMSVAMTVPVAKSSGAVTVPIAAIFRENKKQVVYVRKAGRTERRAVEVGITDLGFAEIRSGLEAGEEILLFAPAELRGES